MVGSQPSTWWANSTPVSFASRRNRSTSLPWSTRACSRPRSSALRSGQMPANAGESPSGDTPDAVAVHPARHERLHGSDRALHRLGGLGLAEVLVVPEHDGRPLALLELEQGLPQLLACADVRRARDRGALASAAGDVGTLDLQMP